MIRPGNKGNRGSQSADLHLEHVLSKSYDHLRSEPRLFTPFFVAGIILSVTDVLRRLDPIPVLQREGVDPSALDIHVAYVGYPTGVTQTERAFASLLELELPYLLWGSGLELLTLLVISFAGAFTIAVLLNIDDRFEAGLRLSGFVVGIDFLLRVIGSIGPFQRLGLLGVVPLMILLYVFVRLFAVPGLLVDGWSIRDAVSRSSRYTTGNEGTVVGLILVFGSGGWLLAFVPYVGTLLSTVLIAPLHAAAVVVILTNS